MYSKRSIWRKWRHGEESDPEANWGYGWGIHGAGLFHIDAPALCSDRMFQHGGAGGVLVYLWVDPVYEIVGCFFSVSHATKRIYREANLFADMITAAVVDV